MTTRASGARSADSALAEVHRGTASATGTEFFDHLVKHLARALGVRCAWVTEYIEAPRRLRALSFWVQDRYVPDYEYELRGTPCEAVIDRCEVVVVPDRVIELFPDDPDLPGLGAVSYMGSPLVDTDGRILGHLAILDDRSMVDDPGGRVILDIFSARAAAELARERRDRELREREARLSGLVGSAMDAILEFDEELTITRSNPAARRTFQADVQPLEGLPTDRLFTRSSYGRVVHLTRELQRRPHGEQAAWIPDGLKCRTLHDHEFPAEGTLSRYEYNGRSIYTLILRNIDDRIEAERRIRELVEETEYLRTEVETLAGFDEIVGRSPAIRAMLADIEQVAPTGASVLISGETGTGKELVARAIHRRSSRKDRSLIRVNCAAIPANLQESELFGHERGAFTGATQRREGRFMLANGGTLFLDEVGEMAPDLQAKLLRVLQEGEFERIGGTQTLRVDVRVVAATNRDLAASVREGSFREDLLYRLNVFPIVVPPLRDRDDDVILIAETFLHRLARERGWPPDHLDPLMRARLRRYEWPGNVRELQNVVERAMITSRNGRTPNFDRALPDVAATEPPATADPSKIGDDRILTVVELGDLERTNLLRALEQASWKVSGRGGAAELLGLHPNTLASRMRTLGIRRPARLS